MTTPTLTVVPNPNTITPWTWVRGGRLPPEGDLRPFLLQLHGGHLTIGYRQTTHRHISSGRTVARSLVPDAVDTSHFVDVAANPVPNVRAWSLVEPPK